MLKSSLSPQAREVLFEDAIQRDLTTARRAALLELLWKERYLTREQLIARVERGLGKDCFGKSAWKDNFYRDMRVVKRAFRAAGFELAYSRGTGRGRGEGDRREANRGRTVRRSQGRWSGGEGYYLRGQPPLAPEVERVLRSSAAEVDPGQIEIYQRLSPADRFRQGCALSDTARRVVAYRILQEHPEISAAEANRLALQRAYSG